MHGSVRDVGCFQLPLCCAGSTNDHVKNLDDGRALSGLVHGVSAANVVGNHAALPVRWPGQRHQVCSRKYGILGLYNVSCRPNVRVGRTHVLVDFDAAVRSQLQARVDGQLGHRANPNGHDDQVGVQVHVILEFNSDLFFALGDDRGSSGRQVNSDSARTQVVHHGHRDFMVNRRKDVVSRLHHGHLDSAVCQIFCHFEADVARADDDSLHLLALGRPFHHPFVNQLLDTVHVANAAQNLDLRQVNTRDRDVNGL